MARGWAQTSVNATIFRKNSPVTHEQQQYIGFYSETGEVMFGKRALDTDTWEVTATGYYSRPTDAHNSISIMVDDAGYLHMSWDHHVHDLRYARSDDDGESWQTSSGEYYQLPITQQSAEIVWRIGENSNLINQTSMTSHSDGTPYIAT